MENFIKQMADRVGISEEQAGKVVEFLREHMDEIPQMLSADSDFFKSMSDRVKGFLGGSDDEAQ
ncbi:MAG: hypothetical protein ABIV13_02955 [Fimbriimonadales bacterium]